LTQEPPEKAPEAAPEETAAQVRRKRSLPQLIALIAGGIVGGVMVLALIALIGGRMYIVSDAGRELVSGFVQGQKISRYGRINVYGLKGDLFDDFTLERVTVTDRDGVWLDARNVRVDWSYWPLVTRRFHATEISAESAACQSVNHSAERSALRSAESPPARHVTAPSVPSTNRASASAAAQASHGAGCCQG